MIVDLDRWLPEEDANASDGRVFPHDLFISHRRSDSLIDLVEGLSGCGVNVVWDCDLDLRDRRVMRAVARAIRRARFVGLYVSDTYTDSLWCRAEYLNALWVEEEYKIQRALVICESSHSFARVPDCLSGAPRFVSNEVGRLAQFVASDNLRGLDSNSKAEELRQRVSAKRLSPDLSLLSFDEQLNLLEQRTLFWAEHGDAGIGFSKKEDATKSLAKLMDEPIAEPEIIFREVSAIVRATRDQPRPGIGEQELSRIVRMAQCIVGCYSSPERAKELTGFDEWAYDFLLIPLLLAVECKATRSAAAITYRSLCDALASGTLRKGVPVYLDVLAAIEAERESVVSAVRSHRMALYNAVSRRDCD